ncbi:MAG: DUF998 domain-containing protein [Pseudoxanthomonas sp.]|nr:DUF998 domain-containing protein [Pseudoxanthomonas sp.]
MPTRASTPAARGAGFAFALVILFCVAALAVQVLRTEYDWWQAPLSFYLSGAHGAWLRAAYYGLALASLLLAAGLQRTLAPAARYTLVPVLLGGGAIALAVTATWPGPTPGHPVSDAGMAIHGISAIASFLLVGTAMLLQSTSLHRDPHWRAIARPLLLLATLAFAGLWLHALWKALPRGGSQKAVIALYVAWLGVVAWRLRSAPGNVAAIMDAAEGVERVPNRDAARQG